MFAVFLRTIKDKKVAILVYVLSAVGFVWMYVGLFPSIQEGTEQLKEAFKAYPEGLMKAFGIEDIDLVFSSIEGFMSVQLFSFIWPIMALILAISLASAAVAGEVEKGTIEILLSQPISRIKIFLGKYLAAIFSLLGFVLIPIYSIIFFCALYDIPYIAKNYLSISILSFLFGLSVLAISYFISSLISEKGRSSFLVGAVLIIMYVLNIISNLKENLSDLKYASLFYYYNAGDAIIEGKIDLLSFWVLFGVFIVFSVLALTVFVKRDVAV